MLQCQGRIDPVSLGIGMWKYEEWGNGNMSYCIGELLYWRESLQELWSLTGSTHFPELQSSHMQHMYKKCSHQTFEGYSTLSTTLVP